MPRRARAIDKTLSKQTLQFAMTATYPTAMGVVCICGKQRHQFIDIAMIKIEAELAIQIGQLSMCFQIGLSDARLPLVMFVLFQRSRHPRLSCPNIRYKATTG